MPLTKTSVLFAALTCIVTATAVSQPSPAYAHTLGDRTVNSSIRPSGGKVKPLYDPILVGECNIGLGDTVLSSYATSKFGAIFLRCGDSSSGYVHIRTRHQADWQALLDTYPVGGSWDDAMEYATKAALEHPSSGYPKDEGSNKWCYTSPVAFKNSKGVTVATYHPTIIISSNNKKVITSFPTHATPSCTGT